MNRLDALISEKTGLIAEKKSAINRARDTEAARIAEAKAESEEADQCKRVGLALDAAASLGRPHMEAELAKLRVEVDQLAMEVGQHLETMNALPGQDQRDYRNNFIWPRIKRQEEASQLISAFEDQLAQQGPQAGSHESSS